MKNRKVISLIAILLLTTLTIFAQENTKVGLRSSVQNTSLGISIPIWMGQHFMLEPGFSIKIADAVGSDFALSLTPRYYIKKQKLSPYMGLTLGAMMFTPKSQEAILDLFTGLSFGAEYFLSDNFSLGVEAQANGTKSAKNSNRFGNPDGINFNTGTAFYATVYF